MAYTLKVASAQDLPINIKEFYDLISKTDKIKNWDTVGNCICVKNEREDVGLFPQEHLKDYTERDWFLPWRGAPLFIIDSEELIVVAPCELPASLIAGAL